MSEENASRPSPIERGLPYWEKPLSEDKELAEQESEARKDNLLLDVRAPADVNRYMMDPMRRQSARFWVLSVILAGGVLMWLSVWLYQAINGIGVTGLGRPVMWAVYIVNFVYFIGIGHAGTFISAALRVLKFEWRRPISRAAEIVTVFALSMAAVYPLIHLGRVWKFYWLLPYPNERQLWPSYHSPLVWDLTAILTYFSCSILFAYVSLIPDIAMMRDHTTGRWQAFYRIFALGWRGTEKEWANHETTQNVFSYGIIPVMFSVHTIVSWDFAMALQPGWHSTVFGPYFVVGALFSGSGAVIIALILLRSTMNLKYFLRTEHFNGMAMFMLILSLTWDYFYFNDYLAPWFGGAPVDRTLNILFERGAYAPFWYTMIICNTLVPALTLWSKKIRTNLTALFLVALLVNVGMYLERVIIVPLTLARNELPFSWGVYTLQAPETMITIGTFCFLFLAYIIFTRVFPIIPLWEVHEGQMLHGLRKVGRYLLHLKSAE